MDVLEELQIEMKKVPLENRREVLNFAKFLANNSKLKKTDTPHLPNKFGAGKKYIKFISDDFDAPLDDLKEYM